MSENANQAISHNEPLMTDRQLIQMILNHATDNTSRLNALSEKVSAVDIKVSELTNKAGSNALRITNLETCVQRHGESLATLTAFQCFKAGTCSLAPTVHEHAVQLARQGLVAGDSQRKWDKFGDVFWANLPKLLAWLLVAAGVAAQLILTLRNAK